MEGACRGSCKGQHIQYDSYCNCRCRRCRLDVAGRDLASGRQLVFAATGVTDGTLMKGVRFFGDGVRTSSLVMQTNPRRIQFIDTLRLREGSNVKIQF